MPTLLKNKKATFNYEILETFHAGIELFGHEVKSLRASRGKLDGAHVLVRGGEAYIVGMSIQPYQPGNMPKDYEAERPRRLLLTKKELTALIGIEATKGLTLIPISCYTKNRLMKVEIASVRGKKQYDKREDIKKRDTEREMRRVLKQQR
ncbi:MAG: SsrA-binding protein SmpB [Candidatus Pacebacteria bacterium]|nr:SsrA-binding protein SmpB [Candidatus Paceibacterota bacterium]